jgi:hypothetical protein
MNLNVKARLFAAVAVFKADQDIRYYLNGVYLEPCPEGGAIIAATNGHAMCVWRDTTATGVDRPIIIQADAKLLQACQGSDLKRLVVRDERLAVILEEQPGKSPSQEVYIQPIPIRKRGVPSWEIEGKFPDWVRVVPNAPAHGVKGFFNAQYLVDVGRAMKIGNVAASKFYAPQLNQDTADSAILVTWNADPDFLAVIMPMRDDPRPFPGWMAERKEAWTKAHTAVVETLPEGSAEQPVTEGSVSEDPMYQEALAVIRKENRASISLVQRHLRIGYNRAALLLEEMEKNGAIKSNGNGTYEVIEVGAA